MSNLSALPKVAVILGAGANIGLEGLGGGSTEPVWEPPLAKDLFGPRLALPEWQGTIGVYDGAQDIALRLDSDARREPDTGFESLLARYANHIDDTTRANFRFVSPFLRDLLYRVSRGYLKSQPPRTLHHLLTTLLAESPRHHVAFITLNYDDFLEQALAIYSGAEYQFDEMAQYVRANRQAKVFKIHGSINWFAPFGDRSATWAGEVRAMEEPLQDLVERAFVLDAEFDHTAGRATETDWLYPVLAAPLPEKVLVCPPSHRDELKDFLVNCRKILAIGTSGVDEDLLDLLTGGLPRIEAFHVVSDTSDSAQKVADRLVDPFEAGGGLRWASAKRLNADIEYLTYPHDDVEAGQEGMAGYVESKEFRKFAQFEPSA